MADFDYVTGIDALDEIISKRDWNDEQVIKVFTAFVTSLPEEYFQKCVEKFLHCAGMDEYQALTKAKLNFEDNPCAKTARTYRECARQYRAQVLITDGELQDVFLATAGHVSLREKDERR